MSEYPKMLYGRDGERIVDDADQEREARRAGFGQDHTLHYARVIPGYGPAPLGAERLDTSTTSDTAVAQAAVPSIAPRPRGRPPKAASLTAPLNDIDERDISHGED